ncbi:DUF4245 domain-containing protein [Arthrobacter sp. CAN_C5]|uniref:DUF4245 domain-containing protein n=1 Tax=Arthrobacter sp. CAN_C5 TaxID=2760706 RepID=UPI0028AEA91D|nr:DUF4245 domain-containing protein [Arthrobacter sp. CAN_C5]MBP2217795.1 hypothetical protein [Arthrobacter sp. CAN_C5]
MSTPQPGSSNNPADSDPRPDADPQFTPVLTKKQAKRANSTVIGMLIAIAATFGLVLPVLLLNPTHTAETYARDIDVQNVSAEAADIAGYVPLAPDLPDGWTSNFARWNPGGSDGVPFWEVGYLTPGRQFIQLTQTDNANPTWTAQRLDGAQLSGQRTIETLDWELFDSSSGDSFLTSETDDFTLILNGTADLAEFDVLGAALIDELSAS